MSEAVDEQAVDDVLDQFLDFSAEGSIIAVGPIDGGVHFTTTYPYGKSFFVIAEGLERMGLVQFGLIREYGGRGRSKKVLARLTADGVVRAQAVRSTTREKVA